MLDPRPNCECCKRDLPPDSTEARICYLDCTFCASCADARHGSICPNCRGDLVMRPRRQGVQATGLRQNDVTAPVHCNYEPSKDSWKVSRQVPLHKGLVTWITG